MRKTLEALYYGNIDPGEKQVAANSRLQHVIHRITECEERLAELLGAEVCDTLEGLTDAQQEINSITAVENFIIGFRLGARLFMECMDDNDGDIQEMR